LHNDAGEAFFYAEMNDEGFFMRKAGSQEEEGWRRTRRRNDGEI
jgi:hypothetical protein